MEYGIEKREGVRRICATLRAFLNQYYRRRKAYQERRARPAKIPALTEGEHLLTRDGTEYIASGRGWRNVQLVVDDQDVRRENTVETIKVSRRSRRKYKSMLNQANLQNLRAQTAAVS